MRPIIFTSLFCILGSSALHAQLPRLAIHDNQKPAGVIRDGVLELELEVTRGMWHPDSDAADGLPVFAIGVRGQRASVPAPLVRVPAGTEVRTIFHNTLNESVMVWGLGGSHGLADTVRVQAGESKRFVLKTARAGTYMYGALRNYRLSSPEAPATGPDMTAIGGFVVDEPGSRRRERILIMHMIVDTLLLPRRPGLTSIIATINGKSWPHTEQFTHDVGDTIVWRVLNASIIPHPMHLHGFYFDVLARGTLQDDTTYAAPAIRKVVTERLAPLTSMTMRWIPERPGNWLFHCHLTAHTQLHAPLGNMKASGNSSAHDHHTMSNLIVGVSVRGTPARDAADRRARRLVADQLDSLPGDRTARFAYSLDGARSGHLAGPTIVVNRNEPTAITVVNRLQQPTAVHWHGIELESFYDGVPGFGGHGKVITPLIMPGDSFTARMTPPRTGTFIYHTHVDELRQQAGGLYGALIVVDPEKYVPADERVIVLGTPPDSGIVVFNGEHSPAMELEAGKTYRLRFVHIMTTRPGLAAVLTNHAQQVGEWTIVAKDGADLPAHQVRTVPARLQLTNGETYDVLYTPRAPGQWRLEARAGASNVVLGAMTFVVR